MEQKVINDDENNFVVAYYFRNRETNDEWKFGGTVCYSSDGDIEFDDGMSKEWSEGK